MITILCGNPGFGKTTYLGYLAMSSMTKNSFYNYRNSVNEISVLNAQGLNLEYPPYSHLSYGNFYCESHIWGYKTNFLMDLDGTDFGLPDNEHLTKFIPPYSSLFFMEGQSFLDSRKSRYFRQSVSRAFEVHRHYDLNIFLDCQRATLIDLNVRGITECFLEFYKKCKVIKDSLGRVVKIIWYIRQFNSTEEYDVYLASGKKTKNYIEYSDFYDGNIFNCINSKQNRALFYKDLGKINFTYKLVEKPSLNLDYIKRFNYAHSLDKLKNDYWQKGV